LNGELRLAVERLLTLSSHGNDRALIDEAMSLARGSNGHSVGPAGVPVAASAEHGVSSVA
jgi:hypothetical protein